MDQNFLVEGGEEEEEEEVEEGDAEGDEEVVAAEIRAAVDHAERRLKRALEEKPQLPIRLSALMRVVVVVIQVLQQHQTVRHHWRRRRREMRQLPQRGDYHAEIDWPSRVSAQVKEQVLVLLLRLLQSAALPMV